MAIRSTTDMYMRQELHGREMRTLVHKFGHNAAVGTSYEPISAGGIYRSPQVSGATAVRVKAGNVADTAAGLGAQAVTVQGLDETGALAEETLVTAGTSASAPGTITFIRIFRAFVSASGVYASTGVIGQASDTASFPFGPYPELTDIGFLAKATTSAAVGVNFEIGLFLKDS